MCHCHNLHADDIYPTIEILAPPLQAGAAHVELAIKRLREFCAERRCNLADNARHCFDLLAKGDRVAVRVVVMQDVHTVYSLRNASACLEWLEQTLVMLRRMDALKI